MKHEHYPVRLFYLPSLPYYELNRWEKPLAFLLTALCVLCGPALLGCGIVALVMWGDQGNWPWIIAAAAVAVCYAKRKAK